MKFNLKNLFTRREILENASLAGLGAALLPAVAASQQKEQPPNYPAGKEQPQSYQVGKDPGKHEPLANFKYDIESTTGWVGEAGSAKEATVAEFPASQNIAGVSMRLKPGAIRELHWHAIAAECAQSHPPRKRRQKKATSGSRASLFSFAFSKKKPISL